ncbi:MAG TPA: hypothetical protein VFY40_12755 [Blastocatellia bacterium]|nr:hypothetical protein [Blastocatellia bacterium]
MPDLLLITTKDPVDEARSDKYYLPFVAASPIHCRDHCVPFV